jgi:hypothetical protein
MAYRASVNVEMYGAIEKGDELYHEISLYEGETFMIYLEPEDEDVDLDLYIADQEGNVIYKDEDKDAGAAAKFKVTSSGVCTLVVKAVDGDTNYTLKVQEK